MGKYINLEDVEVLKTPYLHLYSKEFYKPNIFRILESWIKETDIFVDLVGDFYKQSMAPLTPKNTSDELNFLFTDEFRNEMLEFAERYFGKEFNENFSITIHKLSPKEYTDIHNDYHENPHSLKYGFTHRLITYLDSNWSIEDNGFLNIYESSDPNSLVHTLYPIGNSAAGLEFNKFSYHEVTQVENKARFTINYTFLSKK